MLSLPTEWISALGATVLHSFWQATLLAVMLWLASRYLRYPPRVRYRLAFAVLFFQLVVSALTLYVCYSGPVSAPTITDTLTPGTVAEWIIVVPATAAEMAEATWSLPYVFYLVLFLIWIGGLFLGLTRLVGGYAYYHFYFRQEIRELPESWRSTAQRLLTRLAYRGKVPRLGGSFRVNSPALLGLMKPLVLFPLAMVNQLSPAQVEAVLAHELSHLSRYDHWANFFQSLIEILFYFNPAMHWISHRIREEREHCCDDQVASLGIDPLLYAKTLFQLEEQRRLSPQLSLAARPAGSLLGRIERLLRNTPNHYRMKPGLLIFLLLLVGTLFSFHPASSEPSPTDTERVELPQKPNDFITSTAVTNDSIPPGASSRQQIHVNRDGKELELEKIDGEITQLKVDGETIPKERYDEYEDLIESMSPQRSFSPGDQPRYYYFGRDGEEGDQEMFEFDQEGMSFFFPNRDSAFLFHPRNIGGDFFFHFPEKDSLYARSFSFNQSFPNFDSIVSGLGYLRELENLNEFEGFLDMDAMSEESAEEIRRSMEQMKELFDSRGFLEMNTDSVSGYRFFSFPGGSDASIYLRRDGGDLEWLEQSREEIQERAEQLQEESRRARDAQRDLQREYQEARRDRMEVMKDRQRSREDAMRERERVARKRQQAMREGQRARSSEAREKREMESLLDRERSYLFNAKEEVHRISLDRFMGLAQEFQDRGLIESGSIQKFQISEKKMKVNGKRVNADTFDRFRKEYEDRYNVKWSDDLGNFNLEFAE